MGSRTAQTYFRGPHCSPCYPAVKLVCRNAPPDREFRFAGSGNAAYTSPQACLGKSLGFCPIGLVAATGGLTTGDCKSVGYTAPNGTKTVQAGPCGTIDFNVYSKSNASDVGQVTTSDAADCTDYYKIVEDSCAQDCLGSRVGPCPLKIVVVTGNLSIGSCSPLGYSKPNGTETVTAGPCGKL
eukprot:gene1906-2972_t